MRPRSRCVSPLDGSRSTEGSYPILADATLPELYSIRSRRQFGGELRDARQAQEWMADSLWRTANGCCGKTRRNASFAAVITGAVSAANS